MARKIKQGVYEIDQQTVLGEAFVYLQDAISLVTSKYEYNLEMVRSETKNKKTWIEVVYIRKIGDDVLGARIAVEFDFYINGVYGGVEKGYKVIFKVRRKAGLGLLQVFDMFPIEGEKQVVVYLNVDKKNYQVYVDETRTSIDDLIEFIEETIMLWEKWVKKGKIPRGKIRLIKLNKRVYV